MTKNLLIVESPAKAKTIEKILGKDFTVKSSYGHVRDLDKEGKNKMAIDIANGFQPHYVVTPDKLKVVRELKDLAAKAEEVWLATDEDREGEAISWHLAEVLNLDIQRTKRIVFREITKPAITKAVQTPRTIDVNLVNAQQARRVLDRLVGFELSELLWKKVKGQLSAGRVQSVAVKLVVEREREIQHFKSEPYFKITAQFEVKNGQGKTVAFKADGPERFAQEADAESFLQRCIGATFTVGDIRVSPTKRKPAAPFTTSTLQQEAGRKLGFSVNRTMGVAQRLYEAGHISYMRTDSTNLSETAIAAIATAVEQNYGQRYVQTRRFKTNKAGAQEAHEAIRPTYIENTSAGADRDEQRLYELIWKRTIASQMADAELEKTVVDIGISTIADAKLTAEGEVLRFDGFLKVYLESTDDEEDDEQAVLPPLEKGQVLNLREMSATERFTRPPARFSEPSLVKKLEELGIGRPSTYAPTITKIMEETRGYVRKENREGTVRPYRVLTLKNGAIAKRSDKENVGQEKNKLFATDMGFLVVDFLDEHFKKIMDYGFTAGVEDELDRIADGKVQWAKFLETFYHPFHQDVEKTLKESERVSGERILGKDPKSGRTVLVRMSRLGKPVVQIGKPEELEEKETPKYGNLKAGQNIENITLEDALSCFDLPKTLGESDGQEIVVGAGKYGPYVKIGTAFISLPKGEDPHEVTLERALAIVEDKRRAEAPIGHFEDKPITKGTGRFGPFVKWDDLYVNIPKGSGFTIQTITEAGAIELIQAKREKESNKFLVRWEEENISVEMGRWGPFIRAGKQMFRLPPGFDGKRMTAEEAASISLVEVKRAIAEQGGLSNGKGTKKK
jgi:DNA topoisomerase-1